VECAFYAAAANIFGGGGDDSHAQKLGADLLQRYGINAYEALTGLWYLVTLNSQGFVGPGKQIDCDLDFTKLGSVEFLEDYLRMIAFREGAFGDAAAEGFYRAAAIWGRQEEDLKTGLLEYPYWGTPEHAYDPRAEAYWGYGSILGDRDVNDHCFNGFYGGRKQFDPAVVVPVVSSCLLPFENNTAMLDFGTDNIYSEDMARLVAWHMRYSRFWKQSVLYCDMRWPDFYSRQTEDNRGMTPEGEPLFYNAVTGQGLSFVEGMEVGRKIWNLDNAIWILQGRHRDIVKYADYIHEVPYGEGEGAAKELIYSGDYQLPSKVDGEWVYIDVTHRLIDRDKFEQFKTLYYELEGWDPSSGYPTRGTLSALGLDSVADALQSAGKLGG
jgi:aldehyde:ferredoxin oxidoreductase